MPVSEPRRRKEELLKVLRELGAQYGVAVNLTRDSDDAAYRTSYRKLSHKVHPDKGGTVADQQRLNAAHGEWQSSARANAGGRPAGQAPGNDGRGPGKTAYKERVRRLLKTARAQKAAANHAKSWRKTCQIVVKRKGGASGK